MDTNEQFKQLETRIKRLENKIDRILELLGGKQANTELDDMRAVLATGGVAALKQYLKSTPSKARR